MRLGLFRQPFFGLRFGALARGAVVLILLSFAAHENYLIYSPQRNRRVVIRFIEHCPDIFPVRALSASVEMPPMTGRDLKSTTEWGLGPKG